MSAISHPACNVGRPFQLGQGEERETGGEKAEGGGLEWPTKRNGVLNVFTGLLIRKRWATLCVTACGFSFPHLSM